ncbi:hypothetical protein GHT98_11405 [Pseudomonas aeruginosa]|nr:hypothetical protein [Pseudomonas aeruginosa]
MASVSSQTVNPAVVVSQALLSQFFSGLNIYVSPVATVKAPNGQAVPDSLVPAISRYAKGFKDRPLLLPFSEASGELTCWLACSHDELSSRELHDEMRAFIGPSFGDFEIDGATLSIAQARAKTVLAQAGLNTFAFFAITTKFEQRVVKSWQRYWQLLDQRPPRPRQELRTFHQLRALFDRALVARNENAAMAAMAALRDQHSLSAENRTFLEIRLHSAFGRWDRILNHPQWDDLLKARLPPETYGDIWDALYETFLAQVEAKGAATQLVEAFAEQVRIMAAPLLKSRGRSRRPAARKAFLLHELSLEQPSAELCVTLLNDLGPNAFGPASDAIMAMAQTLQTKSGLDQALHEMELERYEQALALLLPLADSVEVLQAQLRCAKEVGDPGHAREVLDRLSLSTPETADKVRTARARLLSDVRRLAAEEVCESLQEQLQATHMSMAIDDVIVHWRELVQSPKASALLDKPCFIQSLLSSVEDSALDSSPLFESLFPIWFDWLIVQTPPSSVLTQLYLGFIEALNVRDRLGDSEREMIRLALRHGLIAGLTSAEYTGLIERLATVLSSPLSPREAAWALDVTDLLVMHPCRDEEARLRWTTRVVQAATQCWVRLSFAERCLLKLLAQDFSLELPKRLGDEVDEAEKTRTDIRVRIFLYSLDTQAIRRAALMLEEALPLAKIETNSDEVCSARLKTGARNADWVVFVSGVATHQAFFCIKAALRPDAALLQVEGTGTTRIVDCVINKSQMS